MKRAYDIIFKDQDNWMYWIEQSLSYNSPVLLDRQSLKLEEDKLETAMRDSDEYKAFRKAYLSGETIDSVETPVKAQETTKTVTPANALPVVESSSEKEIVDINNMTPEQLDIVIKRDRLRELDELITAELASKKHFKAQGVAGQARKCDIFISQCRGEITHIKELLGDI